MKVITEEINRPAPSTVEGADASGYVREVTARYIGPRRKSVVITSPKLAADFIRPLLRDHVREHLFALYLDAAHRVISYSLVSLGSATSAPAYPREIFQGAVLLGACALVLAHNHPTGDLVPSQDDMSVTSHIRDAGVLLGIKLLDHVIVSADSFYSFADNDRLK